MVDDIAAALKETRIDEACNEFLLAREKDEGKTVPFLHRSLYKCIGLINKSTKSMDSGQLTRKFLSELRYSTLNLKHELHKHDQLIDAPTAEKICEFAELIRHVRYKISHYHDPDYVSTLLGLYMDMSFDPSTEADSLEIENDEVKL